MGFYINVGDDVNIYCEDLNPCGDKTIVFLHGWPGNRELFEYQLDVLPKMGFRCICPDQRGFGKSDRPIDGYTYDRLADDVRCIIEQMGIKNATLLGHSTGGSIAVRYMARHRAYGVSKLILCATAAPSLIQRPNFPYGQTKDNILEIIENTYNDRPAMLRSFGKQFFYHDVGQPMQDWFFRLGLLAAGWATAEVANTWIQEVLFDDLKVIKTPTLILQGVHDEVCYFQLGEAQHSMLQNSWLIPFENSGHALFYEEKDKFNMEVSRFADNCW